MGVVNATHEMLMTIVGCVILAIALIIFCSSPVPKDQLYAGITTGPDSIEYRTRTNFIEKHHGKVTQYELFLEKARTKFNRHDFSRF